MAGAEKDSLRVYDMVIIHRQRSYRLGDIISFDSGGALVTHRIVGETKDAFITKGDANNTADLTPTPRENIIGKVVLSLSQFGRVIQFAKTPAGLAVLAIIGCTFIIVPSLFGERRRDISQGEKSK